jgi:hypothetical protein
VGEVLANRRHQGSRRLASHYNTAKDKKLPDLVRRRKEEALLFERGIYNRRRSGKRSHASPTRRAGRGSQGSSGALVTGCRA